MDAPMLINIKTNRYTYFFKWVLVQVKNGDNQFLKQNLHATNQMTKHVNMWVHLFLGGLGYKGYVGIILKNCVPTMFLDVFPKVFPIATYFYLICLVQSFPILTCIGDPKGKQDCDWTSIIFSCEHNKIFGFWFLFYVVVNFLHANDENYSIIVC